jgi:hypothetical protein
MAAALGNPTDDLVTSGPDEESSLSLIRAQEPDILGLLYRLAARGGPGVTLDRQMDRGHCVGRYIDPLTLMWGAARGQERPAHEECGLVTGLLFPGKRGLAKLDRLGPRPFSTSQAAGTSPP